MGVPLEFQECGVVPHPFPTASVRAGVARELTRAFTCAVTSAWAVVWGAAVGAAFSLGEAGQGRGGGGLSAFFIVLVLDLGIAEENACELCSAGLGSFTSF